MTLVPAVLVLVVGSELIRTSVEHWFNAPMDEILSSANQIAGDYYHERQLLVGDQATRIARALAAVDLTKPDVGPMRDLLAPDVTVAARADGRGVPGRAGRRQRCQALEPVVDVAAPTLPPRLYAAPPPIGWRRRRWPDRPRRGRSRRSGTSGDLLHAAAVIRSKADGRPTGVVVATDYLTGDLAARSRRMTQAFENYNQLRVLKRPLTGVYLSFFLMVTLLILVGATWMGLYLAKRITRPVQMLAAAAREIGAGRLDQRVEPQSDDEFGSLSKRSTRWRASWRRAAARSSDRRSSSSASTSRSRRRRRYIETILERITTGVVSVDAGRRRSRRSTARRRGCSSLDRVDRRAAGAARSSRDRSASRSRALLAGVGPRRAPSRSRRRSRSPRDGQELHLAVVATALVGESGAPEGACSCSTT